MPQNDYCLREYQPTSFEQSLASVVAPSDHPMLPLIHCADITRRPGSNVHTAGEILCSGRIEPVLCDVFLEDLVYTYIGRPAYREFTRPVCFILKPLPKLLQNLFLFDTGAYRTERYGRLVDSFQDIHLFRIPATEDAVKRFILKYFGSNENYFFSREARRDEFELEGSLEEFSYRLFCRLNAFSRMNFDDRCRTLENIIRCPVDLNEALQAIVFPRSRCSASDFPGWSGVLPKDVDIMTYDDRNGTATPLECADELSRVLNTYYQKEGYFADNET